MGRYGGRSRVGEQVTNWTKASNLAIKSIQKVSIAITAAASATTTITAVDTARTMLLFNGSQSDAGASAEDAFARVDLTNSTTVTATKQVSSAETVTAKATVVEFWPSAIRRIQRGTIVIAAGTASNTATITSVDVNKAFVLWLGGTVNDTTFNSHYHTSNVVLTNATTVTATREASHATQATTVGYEVIEFA